MLFHNKCKASVLINASEIQCFSSFTIGDPGLIPLYSSLTVKKSNVVTPYCPKCSIVVPVTELFGICSHCQEEFEIKDLFKLNGIGGIYCSSCCEGNFTWVSYVSERTLYIIIETRHGNKLFTKVYQDFKI